MPIKQTPLKKARFNAGMTQREFSKKVGINPSTISQIEQGWRIIKPEELKRIRRVLPQFEILEAGGK